jgi:hypothetical protein
MARTHAVVWLDLHGADIFEFGDDDIQKKRIKADAPFRRVHRPVNRSTISGADGDVPYFDSILKTVSNATDWAIVGRNMAARALDKYVEQREPHLKRRLMGVEPMERPDDSELLARATRFFTATKRIASDDRPAVRLPAPPISHNGPIRLDRI